MSCCEPTLLCERCFPSERARLTREAEVLGAELARELARSIVPEPTWVRTLDARSIVVAKRVEHLARDARLVPVVAQACAIAVRRHLLEPPDG